MRNVIIGTAGHVDHGKTAIVKALTGRDTDRLREEQERGISIVLGFAPIDLGPDVRAGVVDVPGHERFVKTMVSGAAGVDLALLVIAADEGVMPQTEEHFEVLRLLNIRGGVIAVTKADLADAEIIELVREEIRTLVAGTPFERSPVVATSVITGEGLAELRRVLAEAARSISERGTSDFFRMPIDRVWSRSGIGTIVTGTAWSGRVRKGDDLIIEPGASAVRVREVQSFDESLEEARAGMRTALAIHGVKADGVGAGQQIMTAGVLAPFGMLDAAIEVSPFAAQGLASRQRIRFHHAAAETFGRIVLLEGGKLEPGTRGFVQLRLESPVIARRGDRFIIRSYSPQHVIGGGVVLDPAPAKVRARAAARTIETLRSLDGGADRDAVAALARRAGAAGVPLGELRRYGLTADEAVAARAALERAGEIAVIEGRILDVGAIHAKERELVGAVEAYAAANRLIWGMDREELRERIGLGVGPLFDWLVEKGKREGKLFQKGARIRTGSGERALSEADRNLLERIEGEIREAAYNFATKADLRRIVADDRRLSEYLHILQERGTIVRVSADGFLYGSHHRELVGAVGQRLGAGGTLTIGEFKDIFGFSRKYAVPLLEYLDSEGYTVREGDARRAGPKLREAP